MLKIQVWVRGTMEYSRDTIKGPTPDQTQEQFEQAFINSDECYAGGEVYETCPYFDMDGKSNSIDVYLGGDDNIENDEKPIFVTSDWSDFEFEMGNRCNYEPDTPDKINKVNIWWSHDVKFNRVFYWTNMDEFETDKLKIKFGVDQNGEKYLENLIYDGEYPDDYNDFSDSGYGYNGIDFIYHPDQKFAEEN